VRERGSEGEEKRATKRDREKKHRERETERERDRDKRESDRDRERERERDEKRGGKRGGVQCDMCHDSLICAMTHSLQCDIAVHSTS